MYYYYSVLQDLCLHNFLIHTCADLSLCRQWILLHFFISSVPHNALHMLQKDLSQWVVFLESAISNICAPDSEYQIKQSKRNKTISPLYRAGFVLFIELHRYLNHSLAISLLLIQNLQSHFWLSTCLLGLLLFFFFVRYYIFWKA